MIIIRMPGLLQSRLAPFRSMFSKPQFVHLRAIVLALLVNPHKAKLLHLSNAFPTQGPAPPTEPFSAGRTGTRCRF